MQYVNALYSHFNQSCLSAFESALHLHLLLLQIDEPSYDHPCSLLGFVPHIWHKSIFDLSHLCSIRVRLMNFLPDLQTDCHCLLITPTMIGFILVIPLRIHVHSASSLCLLPHLHPCFDLHTRTANESTIFWKSLVLDECIQVNHIWPIWIHTQIFRESLENLQVSSCEDIPQLHLSIQHTQHLPHLHLFTQL